MRKIGTIALLAALVAVAGVSAYRMISTVMDYRAASGFYGDVAQSYVTVRAGGENEGERAPQAERGGEAASSAEDRMLPGKEAAGNSGGGESERAQAPTEVAEQAPGVPAMNSDESAVEAAQGARAEDGPAAEKPGEATLEADLEAKLGGKAAETSSGEEFGETAFAARQGDGYGDAGDPANAGGESEATATPAKQGGETEAAAVSAGPGEASSAKIAVGNGEAEPMIRVTEEKPPLEVDFDSLRQVNPDVVGWIYGEDTKLNYPVLQGEDNQRYLHRLMNGSYSASGSIFLDAMCDPRFQGDNALLYGHHMKDGSMFAGLSSFGEQEYYEAHPRLWLLTPEGDYMVQLFAGFLTAPDDWVYYVSFGGEAEKAAYIEKALAQSLFKADFEPLPSERLITLSTCDYTFKNARFVLLGALTPVVKEGEMP